VKVLVDTNVVLDVLLDRHPHAGAAAQLFSLLDRGRIDAAVCATTVTTVHYLATKAVGGREAVRLVGELLELFAVAPVDRRVLSSAVGSGAPDYEDGVVQQAAATWGAAGIVTRDAKGFARGAGMLPVFEPDELLSAVAAGSDEASCSAADIASAAPDIASVAPDATSCGASSSAARLPSSRRRRG